MTIPFSANQEVYNNRSGIYAIVNVVTKKFYIGSAVKLNGRKSQHLSDLRKGKHHSKYLQNSYNKHGEEVFIFKVLEYVEDKNLLEDIENNWIEQYKPLGVLYNIREKASSNLGIRYSEEAKKKISEAAKGKIISDETKKKMSAVRKGIIFSDETKKKMSSAKKKPIVQLTKDREFIRSYASLTEAAKETGINTCTISVCCSGKQKSAGGYVWKYESLYHQN